MRLGFYKGLVALVISGALLTSVCAATDISNIRAGSVGNYLGIQLGTTNLSAENQILPDSNGNLVLTRPSKKGFGTRLFWGYQFAKYIGLEGGYTYYSPATYNISNGNSPELRIQTFDILGKGILPLLWGFDTFFKAGAAIVFYNQGGLLAPNPQSAHDGANGITIRPAFGVGASYAFTPNVHVDLSANRLTAGGVVPASTFIAVGLTYHAVDLFCGQFLC